MPTKSHQKLETMVNDIFSYMTQCLYLQRTLKTILLFWYSLTYKINYENVLHIKITASVIHSIKPK